MDRIYRYDIDFLKGIAIIAVVLYHMGICKSGYLGVDVFLVINGFLVMPKMVRDIENGSFKYFQFLAKRLQRLLPLILLVTVFSLVIGYAVGMFPEDYKRLCESVIASNFMSQNILSAVTDKDYWSAINDYKPLMHLWYVGILFEFYLIMPVLIYGGRLLRNPVGG